MSKEAITEDIQKEIPENTNEIIQKEKKGKNTWLIIGVLLVILLIAWFAIRPGVFTIQPIGALPEGVTFIYHSRGPNMPFFSSPDGICLEIMDGVSLMCRGMALSSTEDLLDRIILRLPYSHWAYLRSTGGLEFER